MNKVVVLGSLNMDLTIECDTMPQAGETVEGQGFFTNPGGKGGNQAVASRKLGAPTYLIARVGDDQFGRQIRQSLEDYGVDCTYLGTSTCRSTGVAVITRNAGDNRIILSSGANHELTGEDVSAILDKQAVSGDIFVTQYECAVSTVTDSLKSAHERGLFTIFNPAPARSIPPETYPQIDLIVVNQTECQFLTGIYPTDEESCRTALHSFRDMGAGNGIITLGEAGSVCLIEEELLTVSSHKVPNVDTTAAGDTYIGALASSLVEGMTLPESMRFASKAAALTVTKCGAQQSIPMRSEVDAYFKDV